MISGEVRASCRPVATTAARKPATRAADRSRMIMMRWGVARSVAGKILGVPEIVRGVVQRRGRREARQEDEAEPEERRDRDGGAALVRAKAGRAEGLGAERLSRRGHRHSPAAPPAAFED